MTWGALQANISGLVNIPHTVLTCSGTWEAPGQGYPSDVVNGLAQYVNDGLCVEVPVQAPWSFGPVNGPLTAPSYQQSIADAVAWITAWLQANPTRTFALIGYSQGAEAVSRVLIELMNGSLQQYFPNFIGGITFGNPCRGVGMHAPGIADPGGRGISAINLTTLPTIGGQQVWADYVHSPANGDAGLDMYASVENDQVGADMTLVYDVATNVQLNNLGALTNTIVQGLIQGAKDLFPAPTAQQTANGAAWFKFVTDAGGAMSGTSPLSWTHLLPDAVNIVGTTPPPGSPTGLVAAFDAMVAGIKFLAAPGGPTAPHITYQGAPGYSNMLAPAVGFLQRIATLTPARM